MKQQPDTPVADRVMRDIKEGKVHMRPRTYYTLLLVVAALVVAFLGLVISYAVDIMIFWYKVQTASTPAYGARANLSQALGSFPWWAVAVAAFALIAAIWLVRKQRTMYRYRAGTIALAIIVIALMVAALLSLAGIGVSHGNLPGAPSGQPRGGHHIQNK